MLLDILNKYKVIQVKVVNSVGSNIFLNNYPIYVINLKKDVERRNYIKYLFKRHNINYNLIIVDNFKYENTQELLKYRIKENKLGCILSHLWCINNAINNNYERFIIFEDDIVFHKHFDELFKKCISKLEKIPDLLMLGSIDFKIKENMCYLNAEENIYYPEKNILGAHANMYSINFAKEFLNYKLNVPKILEFDFDYCRFKNKYKIGICLPNLVVCELSTTNIEHHFSPTNLNSFARYKRSFPSGFTYNDYEYMIIVFIQFIKEEMESGITFKDMIEATESFYSKKLTKQTADVKTWLLNSIYKLNDILVIIENIKSDIYI